MSQKLQPVRGTHDILPGEARRWRSLARVFFDLAERYGFGEIRTPIFEFTEIFARTLGDTSDVVTKEMYSFADRGGDSITLRPEFTAAVVRAFLSHSMEQDLPAKLAYFGPAFRYERPQKGRQRQFHQAGLELLGVPEPMADVEVIALGAHFLAALGLKDRVELQLNSLGDAQSRAAYRAALVAYYERHRGGLSQDSQVRLEKNPLRILDSKDEGDRAINRNAPRMEAFFTPEARDFFAAVRAGLDNLGIPYVVTATLVRGLDYYNHTVFEFVAHDDSGLGAQNTVLSGGRYDGLVAQMGGRDVPGVGWGAGLERLLLAMGEEKAEAAVAPVAVVPVGEAAEAPAWKLAQELRAAGVVVDIAYRGNVGKRMKRADKIGARFAVMLGEDELKAGTVMLKTLATGAQEAIPAGLLLERIK